MSGLAFPFVGLVSGAFHPSCNIFLTCFNPLPSTKRRESREGLIHECPPCREGTVRLNTAVRRQSASP